MSYFLQTIYRIRNVSPKILQVSWHYTNTSWYLRFPSEQELSRVPRICSWMRFNIEQLANFDLLAGGSLQQISIC